MRAVKLVMVDPTGNHNKYYEMKEMSGGDLFEARYGRVGAAAMVKIYPMSKWSDIYGQKSRKGYRDMTDLYTKTTGTSSLAGRYKAIADRSVRELMDALVNYSTKMLRRNYDISDDVVTPDMIGRAQQILREIGHQTDPVRINEMLLDLYAVIPRKMCRVDGSMCHSLNELDGILLREQDILDVMAAKVNYNGKTSEPEADKTICQALGLTIRPCTKEEKQDVIRHLNDEDSDCSGMFKRAWRVKNRRTEKDFNAFMRGNGYTDKDVHHLYHGSKNQNWLGILSEGLSLDPDAPITGKMFGHGLYFAPSPQKAIGYTSIHGSRWARGRDDTAYLAVCKVAYKDPLDLYSYKQEYGSYRGLSGGKDAVFAHKGSMLYNDEIIVYDEKQCTLEYLIELKG